MSLSGRIQIFVVHSFWSLATSVGMRRLGDVLKRWYPSAYGDSIFYSEEDASKGCLALTIDDGLFRGSHDESLQFSMITEVCELLRSYEARATFFICTDYTTQEQAREILREGHEIGNHLKEDKSGYYVTLKEDDFARELDETNRILGEMLEARGGEDDDPRQRKIQWFRAPQGTMSRAMCKVLRDRQMINVMCDCYCDDWAFAEKDRSTIGLVVPLMLRQAKEGSVAIFHMPQHNFRESTFDALREFLNGVKSRNLKCVTVSELMKATNTTRG